MSLIEKVEEEGEPTKFILKSKDPQQEGVAFLCQASSHSLRQGENE